MGELEELAAAARTRLPTRPGLRPSPGLHAGVIVAIVVVAVSVIGGLAYWLTRPSVSLTEYQRVMQGMTYAEVRDVAGSEGELVDAAGGEIGKLKIDSAAYRWRDRLGGEMRVAFVNGKVIAKSQQGLK